MDANGRVVLTTEAGPLSNTAGMRLLQCEIDLSDGERAGTPGDDEFARFEAFSGGGHPVSPWGVPTKGYKTRTNKRTQSMIVRVTDSAGNLGGAMWRID